MSTSIFHWVVSERVPVSIRSDSDVKMPKIRSTPLLVMPRLCVTVFMANTLVIHVSSDGKDEASPRRGRRRRVLVRHQGRFR